MATTDFNVHYVAGLARLALTDAEAAQFQVQLGDVLGYIVKLDALDLSGVEPAAHAQASGNVTRPDATRAGLTTAQALGNAPAKADGHFRVVRVVE
ncbi:MAG: Asp-tRNA(Asn)/Glu-tRNA(Gln) amidotransferase subunit GatC [Verrucomicrobiales bacterium]